MPLLDVAKGLACALIVGHHLARYGPLPARASALAPAVFEWLADSGRRAVQVFLVLAGFLAAGSLAPDGVLRIDRPLLRVFQRYSRLAMHGGHGSNIDRQAECLEELPRAAAHQQPLAGWRCKTAQPRPASACA